MIIGADNVIPLLESYRLCWISGRFGAHKTALAFKIAQEYLNRGYRLITNIGSVWKDELQEVQNRDHKLHAVVILDEGGLTFKSSRQIEMIASYARKMDAIYIIPSFWPPTRRAQVFCIQALFNLIATGLPLVVYRWHINLGAFHDSGFFLWWQPSEVYGVYSTQDPGDSAEQIIRFIGQATDQYRKSFGYNKDKDDIPEVEGNETTQADLLTDAVESLSDLAVQISSIPGRKNKRH
jgi:hypothetical protein